MISPVRSYSVITIGSTKNKSLTADKTVVEITQSKSTEDESFVSYKRRSEELLAPLVRFVDNLVTKQTEVYKRTSMKTVDGQEVFEKGDFGIEKTANKIVELSRILSADDKTKADRVKAAVEKGFSLAEKKAGKLPDVALQTKHKAFEKLEDWANS